MRERLLVAEGVTTRPRGAILRVLLTVVVCIVLIGAAAGATYLIYSTEPTAERETVTRKTAALVETTAAGRGTYRPRLEVLGVVEPARDVVLGPRVSGQIVRLEPAFVPGGLVKAGQELLRIDPADFEQVLTSRQAELEQVQASLAIEEGRQEVARQEFELLGEEIDSANRALVLREPQIRSIRAQLRAAEAAVEQAKLDLSRTTVSAPFDAQILSRTANLGSQVAPGDALARLVGVDEYWVMASVPLRDLRWISFPQDGGRGSSVQIRHTTAWGPGAVRGGYVSRLIGNVDQQSRLARVLVVVPDPLARETDGPPMILGTIVELQIEGQPLAGVVRLDREYLRQNDTVWVMADGKLDIREVEVVFRDAEHAFVRSGLDEGEDVVTTSLATVTQGLPLRREGDTTSTRSDEAGDEAAS
ncbi:MAG: efflux RND transporter periplasmic adaptor subunit [Planctomycetota bacterium]|nr:efflux RND transporter periplasmic adaptor subunit [Planctomycetota bacterium]